MAKKYTVLLKRSNETTPSAADLSYGEVALNYHEGTERLFIKNDGDEIVSFAPEGLLWEKGTANNSLVQVGSNGTAFGNNSVVEGISVTNAAERGITSASTNDEIIDEWGASTPESDKFSLTKGEGSHVEGNNCLALGNHSHTEGQETVACQMAYRYTNADDSTVTNILTLASNPVGFSVGDIVSIINDVKYENCSTISAITDTTITFTENLPFNTIVHDEGVDAKLIYVIDKPGAGDISLANAAHAEGKTTKAQNWAAHAEGGDTLAYGEYSHAEGRLTSAGYAAHAEGRETVASGMLAHAEGYQTTASGEGSHAEGRKGKVSGSAGHVEGYGCTSSNDQAHAEGNITVASGQFSHAEGYDTDAEGTSSHSEGHKTLANGSRSHAEGSNTKAYGQAAHAEGYLSKTGGADASNTLTPGTETAPGSYSHAEGNATIAKAVAAHAEGQGTFASGNASHAEGQDTTASGSKSHAEGSVTTASGTASHVEGTNCVASGTASHAEGGFTTASTVYSHAEGNRTTTSNDYEHAEGIRNVSNRATTTYGNSGNTQHSVGIGTSTTGNKNAFEIMQNGDVYVIGLGGYDGTNVGQEGVKTLQQVITSLSQSSFA